MKKGITITILFIALTLLVSGVTYAFYEWVLGTNTDITFSVDGLTVIYNGGSNITDVNLRPSATKEEGIYKEITIELDDSMIITPTPSMNLYLELTAFPSYLKDASFKWELYKNEELTSLATGNFLNNNQGDVIELITNQDVTSTEDTYKLYLWIDGNMENANDMQSQPFTFSIRATGSNSLFSENKKLSDEIVTLSLTKDDQIMTLTDQPATEQTTSSAEYRYYGSSPDNYLYYNCLDSDSNSNLYGTTNYNYASSCEKWRIIGVFGTETPTNQENTTFIKENRVKIIRDDSIGNYSYDSSESTINGGTGINAWQQADLMTTLNSGAYWNRTSGICYNGSNNLTTTCDFSATGLTETAKGLIDKAKYYLGGTEYNKLTSVHYAGERGTTYKSCTSGTYCTDTVTRQGNWTGYVGLMYGSDYGYAAGSACANGTVLNSYSSSCKNSDWLYKSGSYQWTMSPQLHLSHESFMFRVYSDGLLDGDYASYAFGVQPVLYLSSEVIIIDGDGTNNYPYIINR